MIVLASLFYLNGCNSNQSKKKTDGFQYNDSTKLSDIEVTKSFIYLFPSPGDVLERFYEAEIPYLPEFLHDPDQADSYLTQQDKALNMGVYLADIAYTALFYRTTEAVEYLDAIQDLGGELNISSTAFESLIKRAKNNIGIRDSLVSLSNDVFYNMVDFLENSGQEHTVAVISFGAYIESMYLAVNSLETYEEGHPVIQQIRELKYPMENLMNQAESESDNEDVQAVLRYIDELSKIYSEIAEEKTTAKVTEPGVINLSKKKAQPLSENNFKDVKESAIAIRQKIVETN